MGNGQPALRALFALNWETGNWAGAHAFVLLIWQKKHDKWPNSHGVRFQKQLQTALILFVIFI
jgi:hypothetical protein